MKILSSAWKFICKMTARFWAWYKSIYKGRPWYVKTVSVLGTLVVLFMLYLGAVDLNLFWLFFITQGISNLCPSIISKAFRNLFKNFYQLCI